MENKDYALNYAALGWAVIPLYWIDKGKCTCGNSECRSPGKHPIPRHGLKAASTNVHMINNWFATFPTANIGVATGKQSGIWAIDVDPHKGGDDSRDKICELPECYHTLTGGGGDHFIYQYPTNAELYVPSRVEILAGLDCRGDGGYIVMPPSNHVHGDYTFENGYSPFDEGAEDLKTQLPEDDGLKHGFYRKVATNEAGELTFNSSPAWNMDESEIGKIKVALSILDVDSRDDWRISGMALHSTEWDGAFNLWCDWSMGSEKFNIADSERVWRSFTYRNDGATLGTLYHLANERCPNWSSGESLIWIDDSGTEKTEAAVLELGFFTAAQLMDEKIDPIESWWNDGALSPDTISLIAGPPKVKKSFFAMALAMAAACGGDFLGKPFSRPLKIMWVQAELRRGSLKERYDYLLKRFTPDQVELIRDNFIMSDRLDLILESQQEFNKLCRTISYYQPNMVIIDPLFNFTLVEENDASKVRHLLKNIGAMRGVVKGMAVCVVHHAKKQFDPDSPFDSIRGSSAFRGYYDLGILLTLDKSGSRKAYFDSRNRRDIDPMIIDINENGEWVATTFVDDRADSTFSPEINRLISELMPTAETGVFLETLIEMIARIFNKSHSEAIQMKRDLTRSKIIKAIGPKQKRSFILPRFYNPDV